jgi:hypothetical protein
LKTLWYWGKRKGPMNPMFSRRFNIFLLLLDTLKRNQRRTERLKFKDLPSRSLYFWNYLFNFRLTKR